MEQGRIAVIGSDSKLGSTYVEDFRMQNYVNI